MKCILCLSLILLCLVTCLQAQVIIGDSYKTLHIKPGKYKHGSCAKKLNRTSKQLVTLSFYNFLNDSIAVYVNDSLAFKKYVSKDSGIVSTDYANLSYTIKLLSKRNNISIVSQNERKMIQVKLKRKYPVYIISLYNGEWYVRPAKCLPVLK